jgi:hypothetical protein
MLFHTIEWPVARDAEGGGLGGGGGTENGTGSDGAAGGFADAGNASASFDGSVSATSGGGGIGNNSGNVGGGGLDANANGGPGVVDLGQSGASPSASSAMQFSASDAATVAGVAAIGIATIATNPNGYGIAITAGTVLATAGPLADAASHAAHDIGILGADPALADAVSIGMFGTEAQAIDAMNHDGGFGTVTALNGTDSIWDLSVGGNVTISDHIGGHSAYWDNVLGLPT